MVPKESQSTSNLASADFCRLDQRDYVPICVVTRLTCGKGQLIIADKVPRSPRDDFAAEHDVLLALQADGAEGAIKVMVIDVRGDAVFHIVYVDNGSVWLLVLGYNPPSAAIVVLCV